MRPKPAHPILQDALHVVRLVSLWSWCTACTPQACEDAHSSKLKWWTAVARARLCLARGRRAPGDIRLSHRQGPDRSWGAAGQGRGGRRPRPNQRNSKTRENLNDETSRQEHSAQRGALKPNPRTKLRESPPGEPNSTGGHGPRRGRARKVSTRAGVLSPGMWSAKERTYHSDSWWQRKPHSP